MSAERNDQTKKVKLIPSAGNQCRFTPTQRISDLTDGKCSGRHAGHDVGVENTRIGPKQAYLPRFSFMLDRFSTPHLFIYLFRKHSSATGVGGWLGRWVGQSVTCFTTRVQHMETTNWGWVAPIMGSRHL